MSNNQVSQPDELQEKVVVNAPSGEDDNLTDQLGDVSRVSVTGSTIGSAQLVEDRPIRLLGTYPPEWLPDNEASSCMSCDSIFTLIKRRHHCRSCGKIFCGDCCRYKAKLLYLDNKEARVCSGCFTHLDYDLLDSARRASSLQNELPSNPSTSQPYSPHRSHSRHKVQGVLKTSNQARSNDSDSNLLTPLEQQNNKQVIFSDGIRPGTDLSESFPYPLPSSSSSSSSSPAASFSLLTRQSKVGENQTSSKKTKNKPQNTLKNITVCDQLGYLPPIVIDKEAPIFSVESESTSSLASLVISHFKSPDSKSSIRASMESRSCPLNSIINFEEISNIVGSDNTITFLLLKDFFLRVKIIQKQCCTIKNSSDLILSTNCEQNDIGESLDNGDKVVVDKFWCFTSIGLSNFGQNEIVLVLDKDNDDPCIPRDVFKIYLTLHELALRRQTLENLGNLLFQDGLFGYKDTAGLLFVKSLEEHCLENLVLPATPFLVALVLQRWEVPWSKIFPMRLLLRLGHKMNVYPYPLISFKTREPVFYEVGHTIISILGDFRNFRYSITHVDGLKVSLNKTTRKISVLIQESSYQQFNKVLDSSNNEHVLAWSCCPVSEACGHLVSVQNDDGQYETIEFYKNTSNNISSSDLVSDIILGASFIVFSGALKVNQSTQAAKISVVEDGLLIQIQSCTMSALRNSIQYMHHFDIDCESTQDIFNQVEINWQLGT